MDSRRLVMTFMDDTKARFSVSVANVKDDITRDEIKAIMDYVVENKAVLSTKGELVSALEATVVNTAETEYSFEG